jgi:mannosyl-oligosaccharide alpha-1,2-mannosidase
MPDDAYSKTWKKPDTWKGDRGEMRKLQWEGFSSGRSDTWETKEEGKVRKERRDAVKRGFVYAWQKYKDHAWGEWHQRGLDAKTSLMDQLC